MTFRYQHPGWDHNLVPRAFLLASPNFKGKVLGTRLDETRIFDLILKRDEERSRPLWESSPPGGLVTLDSSAKLKTKIPLKTNVFSSSKCTNCQEFTQKCNENWNQFQNRRSPASYCGADLTRQSDLEILHLYLIEDEQSGKIKPEKVKLQNPAKWTPL